MNLNNSLNSTKIVERYSNSACNFEDLYKTLSNDKDCLKTTYETLNGIKVIKADFDLYDGTKEFTFYENGGFNTFGNHKGRWCKHLTKEEWIIYSSSREWTDCYDNSITSFAPYYYENIDIKCGKDLLYFCRDSQTMLLILEIVNKYKLYEIPFERWHERLNADISYKKTNKFFTWSDFYNFVLLYACYRKIAIVGERMFNCNNKKRYIALIKMFCAKANNKKSKFEKYRKVYNEEFSHLLCRLYNPQIFNKNCIAYKIYREIEKGNWCTDLLVNSHKEIDLKRFNKRQSEMYKYTKLKDIICSSSNAELKRNFFNSYNKINSMKLWMLKIKNEFYFDLIKNNTELNKIAEFKKMYEINENNNYKCYSFDTFNRVCKTSDRPYFMKTKDGGLRRFESYTKYEKARKYFKVA